MRYERTAEFFGPTQGTFQGRLVSFRKKQTPVILSVTYFTTKAEILFDRPVMDALALDFTATVNALPNAVVSALIGPDNLVAVTWTTPGVATNAVIIDYVQGTLAGLGGVLVPSFSENGVIP